ncbi:MAG: hypothetical protein HUU35_09575, partial [Armatimonadetes bacterium]|nr:hypothetical protein [Armatimonadota bacterium]
HQVAVSLDGQGPGRVVEAGTAAVPRQQTVVSDTGEVTRRLGAQPFGLVDTPRSQAAYGWLGSAGKVALTDLELEVSNPFAAVAASSLTDEPIGRSPRLLVTVVARAENTGLAYNATRTRLQARGAAPILAEPVRGALVLKVPPGRWRLQPLGADGSVLREMAVTATEAGLRLELDTAPTIYYLLERQ